MLFGKFPQTTSERLVITVFSMLLSGIFLAAIPVFSEQVSAAETTESSGILDIARLAIPVACLSVEPIAFNAPALHRTITTPQEKHCYTFTGMAGNKIRLRMTSLSSGGWNHREVLRPDDSVLCSDDSHVDLQCDLDTDGIYTIVLFLHFDRIGDYELYLLLLNGLTDCTPISYAAPPVSGEIGGLEPDCYSLDGAPGEQILVRTMRSGGYGVTQEILRPDGSTLCGPTGAVELRCELDAAQVFYVLTYDYNGSYNIYTQRLNDPIGCTPIAYGDELITGTILDISTVDCYTFHGDAGDMTRLRAAGGYTKEIIRPDGTSLCSIFYNWDLNCTLDASGTHTVIIDASGQYGINIQRLNNPAGCAMLAYGEQSLPDDVGGADLDCLTFSGAAGDHIRSRMTSGGGVDQELFRPDGSILCGPSRGDLICDLPSTGTYLLLIGGIGGYRIEVDTGFYIGRDIESSGEVQGPVEIRVSPDKSYVEEIYVDIGCISFEPHHTFTYNPEQSFPIAENGFFALNVPLDIASADGHAHSFGIDGKFFDTDGDGTLDQVHGGLNFRSGETHCTAQWDATINTDDVNPDGWSNDAELALGSNPYDGVTSTPENGIVPATTLASQSVCMDFVDNDGDGLMDGADPACPPSTAGVSLQIKATGPNHVSPGTTFPMVVEYANDGLATAPNATVIVGLDPDVEYVSCSSDGAYNSEDHTVSFDIGDLPGLSQDSLSVITRARWALPLGTTIDSAASLASFPPASDLTALSGGNWYDNLQPGDIVFRRGRSLGSRIIPGYLSHVGIVGPDGQIWEAVDPIIKKTPTSDRYWNCPEVEKIIVLHMAYTADQRAELSNLFHWLNSQMNMLYEAWWLTTMKPDLQSSRWYCTELIWAAFFHIYGIDLNPTHARITPDDLVDSLLFSPDFGMSVDVHDCPPPDQEATASLGVGVSNAHDPNAKSADRETAAPGESIHFTVEFENEGEGDAFGVYVTDTLEADIDAATLTLPPEEGGFYDPVTRTITWYIGQVDAHHGGQMHYSIGVRGDAVCGAEVTNSATVYFPSVPEVTPTNSVVVSVIVPGCDADSDGIPDEQDTCPASLNPIDSDGDGQDGEDSVDGIDSDGDGLVDEDYQIGQEDIDGDGRGDPCDTDDDNDTMIDAFEVAYVCLNPFANDASADPDGDGSSNQ
ncbi:MAG: DUF11 domain-containing protein, partial [Anaerolineae bacterium]|nr:DUF11 domain-containing protein [Anaerolineae bacterium]